jgi:hypothetical protein
VNDHDPFIKQLPRPERHPRFLLGEFVKEERLMAAAVREEA